MKIVVGSAVLAVPIALCLAAFSYGTALPQVPNPERGGHKMRPDGQNCQPTGKDACHCKVRYCTRDDHGTVTDFDMDAQCQWFCEKDHCSCHTCPEGDCPDTPSGHVNDDAYR
jgi:hypothetical protein